MEAETLALARQATAESYFQTLLCFWELSAALRRLPSRRLCRLVAAAVERSTPKELAESQRQTAEKRDLWPKKPVRGPCGWEMYFVMCLDFAPMAKRLAVSSLSKTTCATTVPRQ